MSERPEAVEVPAENDRLDKLLAAATGVSRAEIQRLLADGRIRGANGDVQATVARC